MYTCRKINLLLWNLVGDMLKRNIGDVVEYNKWSYPITGYYCKHLDSSTPGKVLIRPCTQREGRWYKLGTATFSKPKALTPSTRNIRVDLRAGEEHKKDIEDFLFWLEKDEDVAVGFCFKVED